MKDVRNADGAKVAAIDEKGTVIVVRRNCVTYFRLQANGKVEVVNKKLPTT